MSLDAIRFFGPQAHFAQWVLTIAGGFIVAAAELGEWEFVLGALSFGFGAAWLLFQRRAPASIASGELRVRERVLGAARVLALRDAERWESYEYPDQIKFFCRGELIEEFLLASLSHSERQRFLSLLETFVPDERFGS